MNVLLTGVTRSRWRMKGWGRLRSSASPPPSPLISVPPLNNSCVVTDHPQPAPQESQKILRSGNYRRRTSFIASVLTPERITWSSSVQISKHAGFLLCPYRFNLARQTACTLKVQSVVGAGGAGAGVQPLGMVFYAWSVLNGATNTVVGGAVWCFHAEKWGER